MLSPVSPRLGPGELCAKPGGETDGASASLSIDDSKILWVYQSDADDIVPDDPNAVTDVFAYSDCNSPFYGFSVGRISLTNLVEGDTNDASDIFVTYVNHSCDGWDPNMTLVSANSLGDQGNGGSYDPSITDYGYLVSYTSTATNLVEADTNETSDIFVDLPPSAVPLTVLVRSARPAPPPPAGAEASRHQVRGRVLLPSRVGCDARLNGRLHRSRLRTYTVAPAAG